MIRYIDLFAGIGGMRLGFSRALSEHRFSSKCVLSSEIDSKACETYKLNFGEQPEGDIREILETPQFDFLLAGFPCQPFSYAGKKLGFGDTRGTLFFEVERLLSKYKPVGFLLENVRGFTSHDQGRTFKTVVEKLEHLGYGVQSLVLNSCNFEVPQNRVRVYLFGLLGQYPKMKIFSELGPADSRQSELTKLQKKLFDIDTNKKLVLVKDILEPTEDIHSSYLCSSQLNSRLKKMFGTDLSKTNGYRFIDYRGGKSIHSWEIALKGECSDQEISFMNQLIANRRKKKFGTHQDGKMLNLQQIKTFFKHEDCNKIINSLLNKGYLKKVDEKYNPVAGNMSFEVYKILDPDSISVTLVSSDAHKLGVIQNNTLRRITPRECARIQGFPDYFVHHPQDIYAYKQFGNSVSVPVVEAVISDLVSNNLNVFRETNLKNLAAIT